MSDDGPDQIPATGKIPTKAEEEAAQEEEEEEEEDDDDDEDEDGEEYRVEKVLNHRFDGSELEYQIKWLGYENKEDMTWEPLENLCVAHADTPHNAVGANVRQ